MCNFKINILFWCLVPYSLFAQHKFERAILLNTDNGLPSNNITAIARSDDGFIWLGTADGLCRYDGTQVKVIKSDPNKKGSLIDNRINDVLPIGSVVWIATRSGITAYNTVQETFRNYRLERQDAENDSLLSIRQWDVSKLFLDKSGELWIGTSYMGVARYIQEEDRFEFFQGTECPDRDLISSADGSCTVLSFDESPSGDILYAGTMTGLIEIDKRTGNIQWNVFHDNDRARISWINACRLLYVHTDGLVYIGTWRSGVNVFNPQTDELNPLPVREGSHRYFDNMVIRNILKADDNSIWITTASGLALYDIQKQAVTYFKQNDTEGGLYYGIDMIDASNRVWFHTYNGLHIFDPLVQQFSKHSFENFNKGKSGFVYYLQQDGSTISFLPRDANGIVHFNSEAETWTFQPLLVPKEDFPQYVPRGFVRSPDGNYTIAADVTLYRHIPGDPVLKRFLPGKRDFEFTRISGILWDERNRLWVTDDTEGLMCWDSSQKKWTSYRDQLSDHGRIPINGIQNIYRDSKENIWFRGNYGFGVYLNSRDTIINFLNEKNETNAFQVIGGFTEDNQQRIWMLGEGNHVAAVEIDNPEKGIVKTISLPDRSDIGDLKFLVTDRHGNVWINTKYFLICIHTSTFEVSYFNFDYGVRDVDFFSFNCLPSGEFVFGGRNQIVMTHPDSLKRNTELPEPYITEISVLQTPYALTKETPAMQLSHWQNFFSIGFSARAFTLGDKVRFRYRLAGFDADWIDANDRRFANYTNVPGGSYTFELQASNNENIWNPVILSLPVFVETPWWESRGFIFFVIGLGLMTAYALYHLRVAQIRKSERLRSAYEKKLATMEMSVLLAQMNPHFLFNCLNSIDSYIIKNESKRASEYLNNFARLMRLILQHSRANSISLREELEALDLYLQMESLRFKGKFRYTIDVEEGISTSSIEIPPMLLQPYVENAIWHGLMHKEGNEERVLRLIIAQEDDHLVCRIEDNGIGREKAMEIKSKRSGNNKTQKSMGMQITRDRIDVINKLRNADTRVEILDLKDENGYPIGTRVQLTIPI